MFKLTTAICVFMTMFFAAATSPKTANLSNGYNFDFCIPIMQNEIKLDGKIDSQEWDNAGGLCTFFKWNGQIIPEEGIVYLGIDNKNLYVAIKTRIPINTDGADTSGLQTKSKKRDDRVWQDDAVHIAIRNQKNTLFHFAVNSKDVFYDAKDHNKSWNSNSFQSKSFSKGDWWIIEVSVSLEELELTEDNFYINIGRDWARSGASTITGGKSHLDLNDMLKLSWKADVPAIKMDKLVLTDSHEVKNNFSIYNTGSLPVNFSAAMVTPDKKTHKAIENRYSKSTTFETVLPTLPLQKYSTLVLKFSNDNNVLLSREIKLVNKSSTIVIPAIGEKILDGHSRFSINNFPGARKARLKLLTADWKGGAIDKVRISATSPDKNPFVFFMNKTADTNWTCLIDLPRASDGKWVFDIEYIDQHNKRIFYAQKALELDNINWIWADNKIGLSDKVIPPFTPLEVKDNTVKSILREHVMGPCGLWQQVQALGENILAEAIKLDLQIDGKQVKWQNESIKNIENTPSKVVFETISKTGTGIELKTISTFDYDGMMWVKMSLNSPNKTTVNRMTINIPMKAEQCDLMHVFADRIRSNPTGSIPKGQGEVWNSKSVPKRFLSGKRLIASEFIPYMWIGGAARGICWFADSGKYFTLEDSVPTIRLKRPDNNTVLAEIDLINKTVTLTGERNFEFGLQATPVKPQDRKALQLNGNVWIGKNVSGHQKGATNIFIANLSAVGVVCKWDKYPANHDYTLMKLLGQKAKTGEANQKDIDEATEKLIPYAKIFWTKYEKELGKQYRLYKQKNETTVDYGVRRTKADIKRYFKSLSVGDYRIYSDPRLARKDSPEFLCFKSEWHAPQSVSYPGAVRIYPAKSWINYLLWYYKKQMENGIVAVYLDDTFVLPGFNPDIGIGGINSDGVAEPQMGILAMRELIKRIAVMQHEVSPERNFIKVHHTDALIIPAFSFANLGFTWEDKYGAAEFQNRYPLDYIRAESTGIQCGLASFTLNGIYNRINYPKEGWPTEFKRLTRTKMALKLLHQIKSYSNNAADKAIMFNAEKVLFDFEAYSPDSTFVPYWENSSAVKLSDNENYKASYYIRQGEVLIIVSSITEVKDLKLKLNKEMLGLSPNAVVKDLLSNQYFKDDEFELLIPKREFTLIYCGPKEKAEKLVSADQRKILRSDAKIMKRIDSPGKMVFDLIGKWDAKPSWLKNPAEENKVIVTNDKGTYTFTSSNEDNSIIKSMTWVSYFTTPIALSSFKGFEMEYKTTNTAKLSINVTPRIANKYLIRTKDIITDSKWHKITKFFSEDENREITRLILHIQTQPGTTSTFEIRNFKLISK